MKSSARIGFFLLRSSQSLPPTKNTTILLPVHSFRKNFHVQSLHHAYPSPPSPVPERETLVRPSTISIQDNPILTARKKNPPKTEYPGPQLRFVQATTERVMERFASKKRASGKFSAQPSFAEDSKESDAPNPSEPKEPKKRIRRVVIKSPVVRKLKTEIIFRKVYDDGEEFSVLQTELSLEQRNEISISSSQDAKVGAVLESGEGYGLRTTGELTRMREIERVQWFIQASASRMAGFQEELNEVHHSRKERLHRDRSHKAKANERRESRLWSPIEIRESPIRKVQSSRNEIALVRQQEAAEAAATERIRDRVRIGASLKKSTLEIALLAKQVWGRQEDKNIKPQHFTFRKVKSDLRVSNIPDEKFSRAERSGSRTDHELLDAKVMRSNSSRTMHPGNSPHDSNTTELHHGSLTQAVLVRKPKDVPVRKIEKNFINVVRRYKSEPQHPISKPRVRKHISTKQETASTSRERARDLYVKRWGAVLPLGKGSANEE